MAIVRISHAEATKLAEDLRAAGLVDGDQHHPGSYVVGRDEDLPGSARPELLVTTVSGTALANARVGKPMLSPEARRLRDGVVARAKGVNASDEWLHWVVEVVLYGSFAVPEDAPVGDVDLAVRLLIGLQRLAIGTLVERTTRFTMLIHLPRESGYGETPEEERTRPGRLRFGSTEA